VILDFAKKALASPIVFAGYQSLVGAPECHRRFVREMVAPQAGERILDIGCGVGASVPYLPDAVDYLGIDVSEAYIAKATADYAPRARFLCADIATLDASAFGTFDRAFSFGVIHHLSDATAAKAVAFVRAALKPGGIYVTIDPCLVPKQHPLAKLMINNDRGEYVRNAEGYEALLRPLGRVHYSIRHDLLRLPYTQIVMWARIEGEGPASDRAPKP
jgi:SAM-dependent methyltransferase